MCLKLAKRQLKRLLITFAVVILPYALLTCLLSKLSDRTSRINEHFQSCNIPRLELWPEEFKQYFKKPPALICSDEENWVFIENGTYRFSKAAVQKHGDILCEAITLIRGDEFAVLNEKRLKPLKDGEKLVSDFSEVRCVAPSGKVFKSLLAGVAKVRDIAVTRPPPAPSRMNILMFGFDSVSRMTWLRNLPETHKYFTKTLGGTVLKGYNIVGDGTPQALLPILTGKNETQLPESRRGQPNAKVVDDHPWVWKEMHKLGYVTQWGEDGPKYGTFTYRMLGFNEQPVDHYMRPFYIRAEMQYRQHRPYCLGSVPRHVNMLNWILELYKVYPDHPKFSFLFHSEFSHDAYGDLNMADLDIKAFLEYMVERGHLDNTVLILMSDHGARYQKVRETVQGKYEERMPYFAFRFPPWFENTHKEAILNLRKNSHRLTTPYDIHETLRNIIHLSTDQSNLNTEFESEVGKSLLSEIPRNRTCSQAGIAAHWCTCLQWNTVDTSDYRVQAAARSLIKAINDLIKPFSEECSRVKLYKVISSVLLKPSDSVLKFKHSQDFDGRNPEFAEDQDVSEKFYQIVVETLPAFGKFEATIRFNVKTKVYVVSSSEISRINKYGNQPRCVQDRYPHLRPYCYCKDFTNMENIITI